MSSTALRKFYWISFLVFLGKLSAFWVSYFTLVMICRLRPLRRLVSRLEIVQGRTKLRLKQQPLDGTFAPQT